MNEPLFQVIDVTLPGSAGRPRLDGVSLTVPRGVTAVVGVSGAGKSSLLEILAGFERPASGSVEFGSQSRGPAGPRLRGGTEGRSLFWVPSDLGLWPGETVAGHLRAVRPVPDEAADAGALADFGLSDLAGRRPGALSAGERSRLAVARAVASGADVLVLDEPLAHVDPANLPACWAALRGAFAGRSAVFATHDPAAAVRESTFCVALDRGRVAFAGPTRTLYDAPPTLAAGSLLGPLSELPGDGPEPRLVRAERLDLRPDPAGPFTVTASRPAGPTTETAVTLPDGSPRTLRHRPGPPLTAGARVAAKLAFCLLAAACGGCDGGADGPGLNFAEVRVRAVPNAGPQLPAPRGVGIGPGNEAFVLDDAGRVLAFGPDGRERRRWDMPSNVNGNPEGVCVYQVPGRNEPLVAVADTHYHRVVLFTPTGEEVTRFGEEGDEPGNFRFPVAVTADDAGRLYVGEYGGNDRVQIFSPHPANAPLASIGGFGTGPGKFQRASGVAWVPAAREEEEGTLLVADAFGDRIQLFALARTDDGAGGGEYRGVLGGENAVSLHSPYDLARAADGTLWIPEYHGGRVTALRADGSLLGRWEGGEPTGPLVTPWGLDVAPDGRVWVADTGNRRLVTLVP